ncbi:MAG: hypothetical protein AAGU19_07810 [Prolixibacteraceae bacterium]
MKKAIFFLFLIIALCWCVGNFCGDDKYRKNTENPKTESSWKISEECLAAIDEDKFSELTKICNRYDQDALTAMLLNGYAKVLNTGDKIEMVDYGFAKCKIKLKNGQTYYVAREFVTK